MASNLTLFAEAAPVRGSGLKTGPFEPFFQRPWCNTGSPTRFWPLKRRKRPLGGQTRKKIRGLKPKTIGCDGIDSLTQFLLSRLYLPPWAIPFSPPPPNLSRQKAPKFAQHTSPLGIHHSAHHTTHQNYNPATTKKKKMFFDGLLSTPSYHVRQPRRHHHRHAAAAAQRRPKSAAPAPSPRWWDALSATNDDWMNSRAAQREAQREAIRREQAAQEAAAAAAKARAERQAKAKADRQVCDFL